MICHTYCARAFSNHIAITENYGLVVITGNVVQIAVVSLFWLWDVLKSENVYVFNSLPLWRYWVIPLAILEFWSPINADLSPNFSPQLDTHIVLWCNVLSYYASGDLYSYIDFPKS
jgi:hypothetical protein